MVYGTRFEIGRGVILTEGSNPSLSAILRVRAGSYEWQAIELVI